MAEFICIHETDASLLPCVLRKLKGSLSLGPPESAAGVGYFQSDDVLVRKRPLASQPPQFLERIAEGVESEAVLIASGSLSRAFKEEATLPIRFKRWLFALAGQPEALAPAKDALTAALPQSLRRAARSESAAEALFFTFLSRLRDAGRLDADVDAQTTARSLAAAVGEAERAFEQAGARLPPLAAIVTNGRVLGALRRGHPLWIATIEGLSECAVHEVGPGSKDLDPKVRAHRALRAVVLASGAQPQPPAGARELAEAEVLALPRTLQPQKV